MNPIDIIIIVIIGFCFLRGLFRGIIKELSSIIGVFAGYHFAYTYYNQIGEIIVQWDILKDDSLRNIIIFLIIFCVTFFIVSIIGIIIRYILKMMFLRWIDLSFGAVFGTIKGILISSVLIITLTTFLPKEASIIKESIMAPKISMVSETLMKMLPDNLKEKFNENMEQIKEFWKQNKVT